MEHFTGNNEKEGVIEEGFEVPSFVKKTIAVGALVAGLNAEGSAQSTASGQQETQEVAYTDPRLEKENNELFNRVITFEDALRKSIKKEVKSDLPCFSVLNTNEVLGRASYEKEEVLISVLKEDFENEIINNQSGGYKVFDRSAKALGMLAKEKETLTSFGSKKEAATIFSVYTPLDYGVFLDIEKEGDTYTFLIRKMNLKEKKIDIYTSQYTLTDRDKKMGGGYSSMKEVVESLAQKVIQ